MNDAIKDTNYIYAVEFDSLKICKFAQLNESFFIFKNNNVFDKDNKIINEADFAVILKQYLSAYKIKIQKFEESINESEKVFHDFSLEKKFSQKYYKRKYELKKFNNQVTDFYEALQLVVNEQTFLKKNIKPLAYTAKIFKNELSELITRLDDINAHIKSVKTEKITRNIYILTIMSALFLPLNLITGFFGMNTNAMFLSRYENSTFIIACLILFIMIIFAVSWYFYDKKSK